MIEKIFNFNPYLTNIKRNIALLKTFEEYLETEITEAVGEVGHLFKILLQKLSLEQMAALGDAFLWQNLLFFFSNPDNNKISLNYILLHLLDNFFDYCPLETKIVIDFSNPLLGVCLPKLNIFYKNNGLEKINIIKPSNKELRFYSENSNQVFLIQQDIKKSDNTILLNFHKEAYDILLADFIPPSEVDTISLLNAELEKKIVDSMHIIKSVDTYLYKNISDNLQYIIPLYMYQGKIRTSFTTTALNGVIFISDGGTLMDFGEALIHEFYHNELNALLQFKVLFNHNEGNAYYSPWREDLRPIGGLVHAIYVFVGVVLFYNKVLKIKLYNKTIREQQEKICKKIKIAFQQLDDVSLTDMGKELIAYLYKEFTALVFDEDINLAPDIELQEAMKAKGLVVKQTLPNFLLKVPCQENKFNCIQIENV